MCHCVSFWLTLEKVSPDYTITDFMSLRFGLSSDTLWNAKFKVKKSLSSVAMAIAMGVAQAVQRVPRGSMETVKVFVDYRCRASQMRLVPKYDWASSSLLLCSVYSNREIENESFWTYRPLRLFPLSLMNFTRSSHSHTFITIKTKPWDNTQVPLYHGQISVTRVSSVSSFHHQFFL